MDIFKLFFEHDLRLDLLKGRQLDRESQETTGSIEDFLRPDPTYSKFYITGTVLPDQRFGINQLAEYPSFLNLFESALHRYQSFYRGEAIPLKDAIEQVPIGDAIILSEKSNHPWDTGKLNVDTDSNVGHKKEYLAEVLNGGDLVLFKEHAHQGFDLHLFSKNNIYPLFFEPFKTLISEEFRFFSINGKRIRSERKFYFETWTIDRLPHGAEEVFKSTVL
jgi:hypothetical protein